MSPVQATGTVVTFHANDTITTTYSNLTIPANGVYYAQPPFTVYGTQYTPNAPIPEAPEAWLRRRVKEVCDLVAA